MTNRVTIIGKLVDAPKVRSFEQKGGTIEIVSLWLEVKDENRTDRFTVEINDPKAAATAKAMRKDVIAEVSGKLRHDRWKDKGTGRWTGKVFIAIDPGEGTLRSKGIAAETAQSEAA
ncbi:MAG: single-stranded DNA-binding protein [Hyphomonadaceae bacterium]|nr:single-stranded DNA-binding protein [Hyphomonadaceae bacterium]